LVKIAKVLGTEELTQYINKYKLTLESAYDGILGVYVSSFLALSSS